MSPLGGGMEIKMSKVWNDRGDYIGSIDSSGRIRDDRGYNRGRIDPNGYIYDEHGDYVGVIRENGYIYMNGDYVGMIDGNGDVSVNGNRVGHIDGYRRSQGVNENDQSMVSNTNANSQPRRQSIVGRMTQSTTTSNPLTDGLTGGLAILVIAVVVAIVSFVGKVFSEAWGIIDSSGIVMVLLLAFIGTWITDLIYNRKNEGSAWKLPVWSYMLTNYILMLVTLFILKQGNTKEIFLILCVTFLLAFVMTLCSLLFHLTYKNEANVNVKSLCIIIPIVCLFIFGFYAKSQGMYPYDMNYSSYSEANGEEMPGSDEDQYSFDSKNSDDTLSDMSEPDETDSEFSHDNILDYVSENNTPDYSKCLSPDDYATYETDDGDTIAYPKNFFASATVGDGTISFKSSQEYPQYNIYTSSSEYGNPIEEVKSKVSEYKSDMDSVSYQYPSDESKIKKGDDGYAKTVLAGMWDESSNIKAYYVIASDGSNTKILEFKYEPDDNAQEDHSDQDYIIDCLYRGTSFTGSTYQMRTYNQFMSDDLGEKK